MTRLPIRAVFFWQMVSALTALKKLKKKSRIIVLRPPVCPQIIPAAEPLIQGEHRIYFHDAQSLFVFPGLCQNIAFG